MAAIRLASLLVGWWLVTSAAIADSQAGSDSARIQAMLSKAKISLNQAIEIAVKEVKEGKPFRGELRMDGDQVTYGVELMDGEQCVEVEVDAESGKVLGVERLEMTGISRRWTFDKDAAGKRPEGWIIKQNNPTKELATWAVEADPDAASKPHVLNIKTANANATYNLALIEETRYKDLNLSVKIRGNTGSDDQGGGLIWRCRDENNYYVCRINPLENNYRVYKVVDGKRTMLQSVDFETPVGRWFTLRVAMKGDKITCYCDGKKWLEATDGTFKDAGMIGLWTKADACTSFDNLQVSPLAGGADDGEKKPAADGKQ